MVLILNLMTEPGETDDYTGTDVVTALRRHAPRVPIHAVLVNSAPIAEHLVARYAGQSSGPIVADPEALRALGCRVFARDLLGPGPMVRHDPGKLGRAVVELLSGRTE